MHRSDCITQPTSINQVADRYDQSWTGSNRSNRTSPLGTAQRRVPVVADATWIATRRLLSHTGRSFSRTVQPTQEHASRHQDHVQAEGTVVLVGQARVRAVSV